MTGFTAKSPSAGAKCICAVVAHLTDSLGVLPRVVWPVRSAQLVQRVAIATLPAAGELLDTYRRLHQPESRQAPILAKLEAGLKNYTYLEHHSGDV